MISAGDLRERYGPVFILELPDGLVVPFSLLSLSDYFSYSKAITADIVPKSILENEIFIKCVKDEVLVENIYKQKAGTPTVVADTILSYSAPQSVSELEYFLNANREVVSSALYQIVNIICLAFSGYTPDDILSKDIHEIMMLLALSERKMLETGTLTEPLDFSGGAREKKEPPKKKKPKVDLSKLGKEYKKQEEEWNLRKARQSNIQTPKTIQDDETPHFEDKTPEGKTVISGRELVHNLNADPTTDSPAEKQTLEDAKWIFGDYLEALKKGEKIKIKTDEQRIAEYNKKVEESKKKMKRKGK